ncbi:DUF3997 domain-containing protein [bacterium]|nr:DUF3997 domain-containing protein [bacterium]
MFIAFIILGAVLIFISIFVIKRDKKSFRIIVLLLGISLILSFGMVYFAILTPFGRGFLDFSYRVAGNYVLYRNSAEQVFVAPEGNWTGENMMIPPRIVEIGWDQKFVLAKQVPVEEESGSDKDGSVDSLFAGGPRYWILDAEVPRVYGPLTEKEFNSLRISLTVHPSVPFEDVYYWRK